MHWQKFACSLETYALFTFLDFLLDFGTFARLNGYFIHFVCPSQGAAVLASRGRQNPTFRHWTLRTDQGGISAKEDGGVMKPSGPPSTYSGAGG